MAAKLVYNYKAADTELDNRITAVDAAYKAADTAIIERICTLETVSTSVDEQISNLQSQIDGAINTWFLPGVPSDIKEPSDNWADGAEKHQHLGDLYYDTNTGYCYRYMFDGQEFQWVLIKDSDITKAIGDAAEAKALAEIAVRKDQGTDAAYHHLYVNEDGEITSGIAQALVLGSISGDKQFALMIDDSGALIVSEIEV